MKLKSLKVGQLILTPKMIVLLIIAFFILGMGVGALAASGGRATLALLGCTSISILIVLYTFLKKAKN